MKIYVAVVTYDIDYNQYDYNVYAGPDREKAIEALHNPPSPKYCYRDAPVIFTCLEVWENGKNVESMDTDIN